MNQSQMNESNTNVEKALAASRAAFAPWLPKGDDDEAAKLQAIAKSRGLIIKSGQPVGLWAYVAYVAKSKITAPMSDFWRGLKSSMTGGK